MENRIFKQLPYGISNYETMRKENYAYVDKTRFIDMENESKKYHFFIRPRKFGKSLFLMMLSCYYDIRQASQFGQQPGFAYPDSERRKHHSDYH